MVNTKLNFFQQIYYAITKPLKYYKLTKIGGGRLTLFIFLFSFIISLFTIIPLTYYLIGPAGLTKDLYTNLPSFELKNGQFYMEERFEEEDGRTYVLIDSDIEHFSSHDISPIYDQTILVSRTNIIINQYGRTQNYNFSDLHGIRFDNEIIKIFMPFIYLIFILMMIILYLFTVATYVISALLYSLVGLVISALSRANLKYAAIFKTAIYSKVTVSLLTAIIDLTPLSIPGMIRMGLSILITCAYVVYGTLSHNSSAAHEEAGLNSTPYNKTTNLF